MNCGTERGWRAHRSANEPACHWCKEWFRKDQAGTVKAEPIRAKPKKRTTIKPKPAPKKPRPPAKCGSPQGYQKHQANGTPICDPCREARNAQRRENYADKTRTKRKYNTVAPCGTQAGYLRHIRDGGIESVCNDCRAANTLASAKYRARKKAEANK